MRKYFFFTAASVYIIFALGIPVYFHYCGGELEKVQFLTKSTSCCDDEEQDSEDGENGCCNDEEVIVQIRDGAVLKQFKTQFQISTIVLPTIQHDFFQESPLQTKYTGSFESIVSLNRTQLLSTFILRI